MLIFFLFFAIVGLQFLGEIATDGSASAITRHNNFSNFFSAFLLLFRCSTGEAWQAIMRSCLARAPYSAEALKVKRQMLAQMNLDQQESLTSAISWTDSANSSTIFNNSSTIFSTTATILAHSSTISPNSSITSTNSPFAALNQTIMCGNDFAYAYFTIFVLLAMCLFLNLFIAVIMDHFEYLTRNESILGSHHLEDCVTAAYIMNLFAERNPGKKRKFARLIKMNMLLIEDTLEEGGGDTSWNGGGGGGEEAAV